MLHWGKSEKSIGRDGPALVREMLRVWRLHVHKVRVCPGNAERVRRLRRLLLLVLRVKARAAIRLGPRKTGPVLQGLLSGMELFFILC